jgi:hypothetical protein
MRPLRRRAAETTPGEGVGRLRTTGSAHGYVQPSPRWSSAAKWSCVLEQTTRYMVSGALAWLVACLLRGQQPAPPRRATHRAPVDCAAKSRLLEQVIMISSRLKDLVKNVAAPLRERAVNYMRLSCQSSLPGSSSGRRQRLTNHELCRAEKPCKHG